MFLGINVILTIINIFILSVLEIPHIFWFIPFFALTIINEIVEDYIIQEVEKRLNFETDIEIYRKTGAMPYELFQDIIRPLNRDKFHICRELNNQGNISKWSIYRKDMSIEDYFSEENKAILTEKQGLLGLIFFVKGERNNAKSFKRNKKTNGRELRQYWTNKEKLARLEKQIIDESGSGSMQKKSVSDPTAQKAIKLISTRTLIYCHERILYVENVIKRLDKFEKEVFKLIFNCDFTYCEQMKHINKNTYYNIYNKCIYYLAQEYGIL